MLGPNTLPIGGLRAPTTWVVRMVHGKLRSPTTWVVHTVFLTHGSYQVVGGILSQVLRALRFSQFRLPLCVCQICHHLHCLLYLYLRKPTSHGRAHGRWCAFSSKICICIKICVLFLSTCGVVLRPSCVWRVTVCSCVFGFGSSACCLVRCSSRRPRLS